MSFGRKMRNLDIFKKVPTDLAQSTRLGGVISIITALLLVFFVYRELQAYVHPEYTA